MRISHSITGIIDLTGGNSMGRKWLRGIALCLVLIMFTGCGTGTQFDDYAVNEGYVDTDSGKNNGTGNGKGIAKEDIKVGVLHFLGH